MVINPDNSGKGVGAAPQDEERKWGEGRGVLVPLHSNSSLGRCNALSQPAEGGSVGASGGGRGCLGNPKQPPLNCPGLGPLKLRVSNSPEPVPKGTPVFCSPPSVPHVIQALIPLAATEQEHPS